LHAWFDFVSIVEKNGNNTAKISFAATPSAAAEGKGDFNGHNKLYQIDIYDVDEKIPLPLRRGGGIYLICFFCVYLKEGTA